MATLIASAHTPAHAIATLDVLRYVGQCEMDEATGMAKQVGAKNSPKLKVRFAPEWLSFLDAVWGDYWVLDLDANYRLVAVGEPSREYLWVLSRTPTVPKENR
jgi:lipocalin